MGSLEKSNERDISPSSVAEQAGPAGEEEGKVASTSAVDSNVIETRPWTMQVGVAEDRNGRWRRSMEDAHIFSKDFDKVPGQGYFAVFDGHAGKFAAEWCRDNMEALLMHELRSNPGMDVREVMNNNSVAYCTRQTWEMPDQFFGMLDNGLLTFSRNGKAIRLTYDHKGTDELESKRITEKGGFLLNNRVNGVLAVTRSLGDFAMKEFVVGNPFTTSIELGDEDNFFIVACDGVSISA